MKPAPMTYLMTVPSAALVAAVLILRDLDVPILWSMAIAVAAWTWLMLMLWSTGLPGRRAPPRGRSRH
jgi:hypothetical protein